MEQEKTMNPITLVKEWIARYKYKKKLAAKLKEAKEKDPYIYD
jgi:hypothetical protein